MAAEPHRPSADAIFERMQTALARAASHGRNPKETAQVGVLKRKWQRFLSMFGERLQFDAKVGPTLEIMRQFTSYVYVSREGGRPSAATQRIGCGDSYYKAYLPLHGSANTAA